jgi:hypothetical protein
MDGDVYVKTAADPNWRIQTKPLSTQEALWRIVYDNDFYPQHPTRDGQQDWVQPWKEDAGSGWDVGSSAANGRTFKFNNGGGTAELRFDPRANSTTQTLTDYLVYDLPQNLRRPNSADDEQVNQVSDLKLVAYYHRNSGDGPLELKLSRYESLDHTFTARITPDTVSLMHQTNIGTTQIGSTLRLADLGIKPGAPIFVEFMNVDYQVTLRLNGKIVLQSKPADYAPNIDWLQKQWSASKRRAGEAAIDATNQSCTLDHISLWRDIYYTRPQLRPDSKLTFPWASQENPTTLSSGEYFVMGDNSLVSEDARFWDRRIELPHEGLDVESGRVPEQFLLGKAVFVYWPAGFRAFDSNFSIIPNFGDMRWIH